MSSFRLSCWQQPSSDYVSATLESYNTDVSLFTLGRKEAVAAGLADLVQQTPLYIVLNRRYLKLHSSIFYTGYAICMQ